MNSLVGDIGLQKIVYYVTQTCNLDGQMAEVGVFRGGSAKIISKSCTHKLLHLFDTFTGHPFDDVFHNGFKKGVFNCFINETKVFLQDCKVEYHVGIFPNTTKNLNCKFSFVHLDGDLYQTTMSAIEYFYPRLVNNGIMVFDDYDNSCCPGVKKAIHTYFYNPILTNGDDQAAIIRGKTKYKIAML